MKCNHSLKAPANGSKTNLKIKEIQYIIFTCNPGYTLKGESSAKCVNGKWSSPTPKCIKN